MICRLSLSSQLKERSEHDGVTTTATTTRCSHSRRRRPCYWMTWQFPSVQKFDFSSGCSQELNCDRTELSLKFKHCLRWWVVVCLVYDVVFGGYHSGWLMSICAGLNVINSAQLQLNQLPSLPVESLSLDSGCLMLDNASLSLNTVTSLLTSPRLSIIKA